MFFAPAGDHYRTRLTHTLEVSQIARTIAKVLRLHEELTEAIALGHDLGHTPFGHAGERVLDALVPGGFNHYEQSLRIVDVLENDGQRAEPDWEVRDGIAPALEGQERLAGRRRRPTQRAATLEGQIVRVADIIAYVNHDIDDAVRAGVLQRGGSAARRRRACSGTTSSARIGRMVKDVVDRDAGRRPDRDPDERPTCSRRRWRCGASCSRRSTRTRRRPPSSRRPTGILGGLWEKVRERPDEFLDRADHRGRGARRGRPGLPGRHDRSLRRGPLRAAVHPQALGRARTGPCRISYNSRSAFRRTSRQWTVACRDVSMQLDLTRYRQPVSARSTRTFQPGGGRRATGDAYRVVAPVELAFDIHKDKDRFRLVGHACDASWS